MWSIKVNTKHLRIAVALAIPFSAAVVIACGPDFPLQVLDDRAGTLKATPANSFAYEAAHLVKPGDALLAMAFELMAQCRKTLPDSRVLDAIVMVAAASGTYGMVGGQVADIEAEGLQLLEFVAPGHDHHFAIATRS